MAQKVTAQVLGGQSKVLSADTVRELAEAMELGDNHTIKINGETASYDTVLEDYNFVTFGEKVKGGLKVKTILRKRAILA